MAKAKYKQRKDGRFQTSVVVDGKKKWISAKSSEELDKKVIEIKYLDNKGISLNNDDVTMSKFAEKWLEINSVGKEEATVKDYKYIINSYINPNIGNKKIKSIKIYDIQTIINSLVVDNHLRLARRVLTYTKKILNDAVQNDIILKNPASAIKPPKYKPNERKPLSDEEDRLLIKCAETHKHGLFFLLIRFTGIRKEEAAAIKINNIDLKNNTITIDKAVSFITNQGKEKSTKNSKSRNVYILDIFRDPLKERVDFCKKNNIKYLFTKQTNPNERLSNMSIRRMLESFLLDLNQLYKDEIDEKNKKLRKKIKYQEIKFSLHQLRHSFCTMLYYSGIGIKEAQELMGHSSADMVYNIYTHLDMEKGKPYEKLNKAIQKYI